MQNVAAEMNLAETAFLVKIGDEFNLRWFTPAVEIALCGHATLASAHILWETGTLAANRQARFHTKSGLLTADHAGSLIELNFPAQTFAAVDAPPDLFKALHIRPRQAYESKYDYLVEVETEEELRALAPDFALLKTLHVEGTIVTCRADGKEYDFKSRFFAPAVGIDEDPVTGSVHCCLGPYWRAKLGKDELRAYQASKRGGSMNVKVEGNRVKLRGNAVTIFEGKLVV
jgi:PhzF family phenazine biosynthesis protein